MSRMPCDCRTQYIELLKRVVLDVFSPGRRDVLVRTSFPDRDSPEYKRLLSDLMHSNAMTMLPIGRLDNIQQCIETIVEDGVPGDLIETGVWRGGATILMKGILKAHGEDRSVWVADSFEGLPQPERERHNIDATYHASEIAHLLENMAVPIDQVRGNFDACGLFDEHVKFLKGWFSDTLPNAPIQRLALIRHDGDYYESTMATLMALYERLSVGGIVIVDDYGADFVECTRAVDEFRAQRQIADPMIAVDPRCHWWRKTAN